MLLARAVQQKRLQSYGICCNAQMTRQTLRRFCTLDWESEKKMEHVITRLGLSARAYTRILRVSRTVADLENTGRILPRHVAEAIQYRTLDYACWQ